MSEEKVAAIAAEFEAIKARLMAVTDSKDRSALLGEIYRLLQDLEILIRLAENENPH